MKKYILIIIIVFGFLLTSVIALLSTGAFKPTEPEKVINILEDKLEQDSSKIKIIGERAVFALKLSVINDSWSPTGITERNISKVDIVINEDSSRTILITFDEEGKNILEKVTNENIGKQLGIFVDDAPISIPTIREMIKGGQVSISDGSLSDDQFLNFKARLLGYSYKDKVIK